MSDGLDVKRERAERVNELLRVIAGCGRRFFSQDADRLQRMESPRIAHMEVDWLARVWHWDAYSGKRIFIQHPRGKWRGFTNGGTLRALVEAFREYISHGKQVSRFAFGPWPQDLCGGDLWGYGEDMQLVRDAAARLGISNSPECKLQTPPERGAA